jgi:hypothetical protein
VTSVQLVYLRRQGRVYAFGVLRRGSGVPIARMVFRHIYDASIQPINVTGLGSVLVALTCRYGSSLNFLQVGKLTRKLLLQV